MITSVLFTILVLLKTSSLANFISLPDHPEYIQWTAYILFLDTLTTLPFARLRQEGRPKRYAFIKVASIIINVLLVIFFLNICPKLYEENPNSIFFFWYDPEVGIGYYIIANIIASLFTLIFLAKELGSVHLNFDFPLWKKVMSYSYPLIIVGLGGMINEMLSRLVYVRVLNLPKEEELRQLGIFGANYKLAVLITIFIQVFRMAAEPFFFNQSTDKNAPQTYARVMKFFVIACCFMWLAIVTNLEIIKYLGYGNNAAAYSEGLVVIPILAMASVFLGIYYNLSVWYKLTNRTLTGAWITLAGAVITIVLNVWWIPLFGYIGCAWATLVCYAFMMVASYLLGQKHYFITYPLKKLFAYILIVGLMFCFHYAIISFYTNIYFSTILSLTLITLFAVLVIRVEKRELQKVPFFARFLQKS